MLGVKLFDDDFRANQWLETYALDVEVIDVKLAATESRNVIMVFYKKIPLPFEPSKEELYEQERNCAANQTD